MSEENVAAPVSEETAQEAVEALVVESNEPEVDQSDLFEKRFSALSKREKRLQEEKSKYSEYKTKLEAIEKSKESGALEFLISNGFSLDDVINAALGGEEVEQKDPVDKMREDFEAYKKEQEDKLAEEARRQEEENQNSIKETIENHKQAITEHVRQNPEKYELIESQGQHDLVWEVTEAHFQEFGEILSIEEASDKVEAHLEARIQELLKLKKFSKQEPETLEDRNLGKIEKPTLNSSYSNVSVPVQEKALTREESLRKAASMLKWK